MLGSPLRRLPVTGRTTVKSTALLIPLLVLSGLPAQATIADAPRPQGKAADLEAPVLQGPSPDTVALAPLTEAPAPSEPAEPPAESLPTRQLWLSVGYQDESVTGAIGGRYGWFGAELGINRTGNMPDTEDFSIPHNDFTSLGTRYSLSGGLDLLGFLDVSDRVSLYAGPGVYLQSSAEIIQSNATGWLYQNGPSSTSVTPAGQAGLHVRVGENFVIGGGYHSLRGPNLHLGWQF